MCHAYLIVKILEGHFETIIFGVGLPCLKRITCKCCFLSNVVFKGNLPLLEQLQRGYGNVIQKVDGFKKLPWNKLKTLHISCSKNIFNKLQGVFQLTDKILTKDESADIYSVLRFEP